MWSADPRKSDGSGEAPLDRVRWTYLFDVFREQKMKHLNYCRQLVKTCMSVLSVPDIPKETRAQLSSVIDLAGTSTKFILPPGGRLFDDLELRAIDENEPLRLPYKYIALEYENSADEVTNGEIFASKRIVFAREREGWIAITIAYFSDCEWRVMPECSIPPTGYLDRSLLISGRVPAKFLLSDSRIPASDYADEIGAMLCFLNILQCQNVHVERSDPRKIGKKLKTAIPFDSYHVLTIDTQAGQPETGGGCGLGRHPREHLRRGHIRRISNSRRIWVNATVVNAGIGGRIEKDYRIRHQHKTPNV